MKNKIVLIPFPFDDFSSLKVRPALCLTQEIGIFGHIVVAFLTSKIPDLILETDLIVDPHHQECVQTGLKVLSALRLHRLITIPRHLIKRELGMLPLELQEKVSAKLRSLFQLS